MNNLADRIVALGILHTPHSGEMYWLSEKKCIGVAEQVAHSWEVAGAVMEKCVTKTDRDVIAMWDDGKYLCAVDRYDDMAIEQSTESLPHAIILACVEALEAT